MNDVQAFRIPLPVGDLAAGGSLSRGGLGLR